MPARFLRVVAISLLPSLDLRVIVAPGHDSPRLAAVPTGTVDLAELTKRLATRVAGRAEATVQSDVRMFLLTAPLGLEEGNLVDLETPAGEGRRIDVETGYTVIEVKRDLRVGNVRMEAIEQLAGYVRARQDTLQQRYVGVLTDGAEWRLYHLVDEALEEVSVHEVSATDPDPQALAVWLEGVLATTQQIVPTPTEVGRRLGADSPAHRLDFADLAALHERNRDHPGVKVKRALWAKLLTTAFGASFKDEDALFIEHTLLVTTADVIAHAVVGLQPATLEPATLLSGTQFEKAQISGVVEEDFFDWLLEVDGGTSFVRTLARRLSRFDWDNVEHDIMKVLYESVIDADQRHSLGEYYTPDWLAQRMVDELVEDPLEQRVLDPACGSGTFLFHAVRRYLAAAEDRGDSLGEAVRGAGDHVIGVDVHPVAVTFARVTYLLAIGLDRVRADDRGPMNIPVYLGDTVQWGQVESVFHSGELAVPTGEGGQLFANELRFPETLLTDAGQFDRLVSELADKAANRTSGSAPPSLNAVFRRYAVPPEDQALVAETFKLMCDLHDEGSDHIWGYYVRNLARPVWLARSPNRVDVLIGNPPWLSYRFMTAAMQVTFKELSQERRLWAGGTVSTHQDLSGLFVTRCIQLYLKAGCRFGFVMPLAVLSRRQFAGFRAGEYPAAIEPATVLFDEPWDLDGVRPHPFPVPSSVVFGTRGQGGEARPLPSGAKTWTGQLTDRNASWETADPHLSVSEGLVAIGEGTDVSAYRERFGQGASVVPRMLFLVDDAPAGPLGAGAGRKAVRSHRSSLEKRPWRDLPGLEGVIETQFIRPLHLGATIAPFRPLEPLQAVVPWDGKHLLAPGSRMDLYPGLADWWGRAETLWQEHRAPATQLSLLEQFDYRNKATHQFPPAPHRVVYSKAGNRLASARISDLDVFIDHMLYWAAAASVDEARYLTAVLNSQVVLDRVAPFQSRGAFGPRHFDLYVFYVPIPLFDANNPAHMEIAALASRAEEVAAATDIPAGTQFQAARRRVRTALDEDGVGADIEEAISELLPPMTP